MKALKEKRISLRSLWRMGLVALSVFALVFVACTETGTTDGGNQPGNVTAPSRTVPTSVSVEKYPDQITTGNTHEGDLITTIGWGLKVTYSDGTQKTITDPTKISIAPSIYDTRVGTQAGGMAGGERYPNGFYPTGYKLSVTDNGRTADTYITINGVKRILDIDIGGDLAKKDYLIDEIPDVTGIQIYGVYSKSGLNPGPNVQIPGPQAPPGWAEQADYYRNEIPFTTNNPDYGWAWVNNAANVGGVPNPGSFIDDRPGILFSIGSYGYIYSRIIGQGTYSAVGDTVLLRGKREPIETLAQVRELAWNPAPTYDPIFFDDPRYISAVTTVEALNARMDWWLDTFTNAAIKVTYDNGREETYSVSDLRTRNAIFANSVQNWGWGGTWANLEIFPVSRDGLRIDVTKDNKQTAASENVKDFDWITYGGGPARFENFNYANFGDSYNANNPAAIPSNAEIIGDGGWAQWAQQRNGNSRIMFYWRGAPLPLAVDIFNRPRTLSVSKRDGGSGEVIMNGGDYVYRTPEGMATYLGRIKVAATYIMLGTERTGTRPDLGAAIADGSCRGTITAPVGREIFTGPTLYSETIWNFKDVRTVAKNGVMGDLETAIAFTSISTGTAVTSQNQINEVMQTSFLTRDASEAYNANRAKTVRGTVNYIGWAGDPDSTYQINSKEMYVGPYQYVFNWDE